MYPTLPFGPLTLPTSPVLTLCAVWLGLDLMARFGRRLGLHADDAWNVGMVAAIAGLVVARLWTVVLFRDIYFAEPLLLVSLRPTGFALWPGVVAGLCAAYGYMLYKALDPLRVLAAASVGALMVGILRNVAAYLTATTVGTLTDPQRVPWALLHFGEARHPAALYEALGLTLILVWRWFAWRSEKANVAKNEGDKEPQRIILTTLLAYCLLRLFVDGFVANSLTVGGLRVGQVAALSGALAACVALARIARASSPPASQSLNPEKTQGA